MAKSIDHECATIKSLQLDPEFARAYLEEVLKDGDSEEIRVARQRIVKARSSVKGEPR